MSNYLNAQQAQQNWEDAAQKIAAQRAGPFREFASATSMGGGGGAGHFSHSTIVVTNDKGKSMLQEMSADIKTFIRDNKGLIYFVLLALIVDHIFFKGAFKERLQKMGEKLVTKVEDKIHQLPESK